MRFRILITLLLAAAPLGAQTPPFAPTISLSGGMMQFDLSGTGDTPMAALRIEAPYSRLFLLEGGIVGARPRQQFGDTTTFVVLEGQGQLQFPIFIFRPYLGAGAGVAIDFRDEDDGGDRDWLTMTVAGGVRAPIRDRLGIRAELRVRELGREFTGSTAEWTLGASWRL